MKVWFHTLSDRDPDEDGLFDYDTWSDSKLFASLRACQLDAEREREEDLKRLAERYQDSLQRYEGRLRALEILKQNEINAEELWFNVPDSPPEFQEPSERYIYSLDIIE